MKDREFDALIKKGLIDHETAVPADMWNRISGEQKRPKPGIVNWHYLLIILLILVGVCSFYFIINSRDRREDEMLVRRNENSDPGITKNTEQDGNPENDLTTSEDAIRQHSQLSGKNVSAPNKSINNVFSNNQKKRSGSANRSGKLNHRDKQNKARPVATGDQADLTNYRSDNNNKETDPAIAQKKSTKNDMIAKADSLSNAQMDGLESENDKIAIEIYASPDFPLIVFNAGNSNYEQSLKTATTGKLSYTLGVRFSYLITKRLSAKIGLQYSRLNESISFKDSLGNTVQSNNRYKTLGIPLLLCYQVAENDKLRMSVNAGLILNFGSRYSGIIPSMNGEAIDIKQTEVYDENVGAAVYLGIDISKQINSRSDFFVEPRVSYSLENMVNPFYAFSRKTCSPGLSFGWRHRLYKEKKAQLYLNK